MEKVTTQAKDKIRKQAFKVFTKVIDRVLECEFDLVFLRISKLYELLKVFEDTTLEEESK